MYEVRVAQALAETIAEAHGPERTGSGPPSEWDFWSGPLLAARLAFRRFDLLPFDDVPAIRHLHFVDPVFGALVFTGVLLPGEVVEICAVAEDPDYWNLVEDDPGE